MNVAESNKENVGATNDNVPLEIKPTPTIEQPVKRKRGRPRLNETNTKCRKTLNTSKAEVNFDDFGPLTANNGFARGLQPDKILCGFLRNEKLLFVFKFKKCSVMEIISAEELKVRAPQMLIKYYEANFDYE